MKIQIMTDEDGELKLAILISVKEIVAALGKKFAMSRGSYLESTLMNTLKNMANMVNMGMGKERNQK